MSEEEGGDNFFEEAQAISSQSFLEIFDSQQLTVEQAKVVELGKRLKDLVDGYREALRCIQWWDFKVAKVRVCDLYIPDERLHNIEWIHKQAMAKCEVPSNKKRWVIRRIAIWFMEAHINARLEAIARQLRILSLTITANQTEEDTVKIINSYIEQLDRSSQMLFTWGGLKSFFLRPGKLIAVFIWFSPIILLDISSASTTVSSITNLTPDSIQRLISYGLVLLILVILLIIIFLHLGFPAKRVVFTGGIQEFDRSMGNTNGEGLLKYWNDVPGKYFYTPQRNIYQLEQKVFDFLGVHKPVEFPVDAFLNIWVYLSGFALLLPIYLSIMFFINGLIKKELSIGIDQMIISLPLLIVFILGLNEARIKFKKKYLEQKNYFGI